MNLSHEQTIERYLDGVMSPAEEQEFHALLGKDTELYAMLQAEHLIRTAMQKDRNLLTATDHSHSYARFLRELAANAIPASENMRMEPLFPIDERNKSLETLRKIAMGTTIFLLLMVGMIWLAPPQQTNHPPLLQRKQQTATPALPSHPEISLKNTEQQSVKHPVGTGQRKTTQNNKKSIQPLLSKQPIGQRTLPQQSDRTIPVFNNDTIKIHLNVDAPR